MSSKEIAVSKDLALPLRFYSGDLTINLEGPTIIDGDPSLLFQHDQLRLLQKLSRDLEVMIRSFQGSRHHRTSVVSPLDLDPFFILEELVLKPHRGFSRHWCSQCAATHRLRNEYGLFTRRSAERLRYQLKPQALPPGLRSLGEEIYRIGPFAIFLGAYRGQKILTPVPTGLAISDRRKIFEAVAKINDDESRSPVFTSIKLDRILNEREEMAAGIIGADKGLIEAAAYASVGLLDLYPLLLDDSIAEFYVDRAGSFAYLDHRELGRCLSSVRVGASDMERLITFARMASGKAMDYSSPSLRASLRTPGFNIRVSADGPPLSLEGTSLSCRKFFIEPLTIEDLVSNGTMPPLVSSFLSEQILRRRNITIYGESGSGKTTLAVALDLLTPSSWRKFSVESDVAENVSQLGMGLHQVRLLSAGTTPEEQARRTHVLNSLLHKSPDYVFLGEVLSREDSVSLFQILAAGLKCIHTVHAETAEALLRRWVFQHGINPASLHNLDLLVHMKKGLEEGTVVRRVARLSQVEKDRASIEMPLLSEIYSDEGTSLCDRRPAGQPLTTMAGAGGYPSVRGP